MPGPKNKRGLTPQQEAFCHEYLVDMDHAEAARRAGYKGKDRTALGRRGNEALKNPKVAERIHDLQQHRNHKTNVTAERVVEELARMGFSRITDAMSWDEKGNVTFTASSELHEDIAPAISEYYETSRELDDGSVYKTRRFKMHDKMSALKELVKHTGIGQNEGVNVTVNIEEEKKRAREQEDLYAGIDEWRKQNEKPGPTLTPEDEPQALPERSPERNSIAASHVA